MYMSDAHGGQTGWLQMVGNHHWVLRIKPWFSGRVVSVLVSHLSNHIKSCILKDLLAIQTRNADCDHSLLIRKHSGISFPPFPQTDAM